MKRTLVDLYFSESDARAIEDAVTRAEATTSGEMAVEVVNQVANWRMTEFTALIVGFCLCAALSLWLTHDTGWGMYYDLSSGVMWGILGAAVGYLLARFVIGSKRHRIAAVWQFAVTRFGKLPATRGETAVLIFISLLEEHAVLVADQKIAGKVAQAEWDMLQSELTANVKAGRHSEGIIEVVGKLGTVLAQHFPRQSDDANELSNRPRLGSDPQG